MVYAIPSNNEYFDKDLIKKIKDNQNNSILLINNEYPEEYIKKFNRNFNLLKSPQAQFVYNLHHFTKLSLISFPFYEEFLTNINISFLGYGSIYVDYKILVVEDINVESITKFSFTKPKKNFFNNKKITLEKTEEKIKWDFNIIEGNNILKCRVDDENNVNVIYQNTFDFEGDNAFEFFDNCFDSFYNNNYPIIIIEDFNNGGYSDKTFYFQAYLDLRHIPINYMSFRYNNDVKNNIAKKYNIKKFKTCEVKSGDYCFKYKSVIDNYGDNIIHKRTKIFEDEESTDLQKIIDLKKKAKTYKNIRKPHEIIILTDGYSFSAGSSFIKGIQLNGGAIVVGYLGYLGKKTGDKLFDASQSPTTVRSTAEDEDELSKEFQDLGFEVTYSIIEYFSKLDYKNEENIPLEYQINKIDESIDIYDFYDDLIYQKFIDESLKIFNKYKNECNYNENLLFITEQCNFPDPKMHGGYKCKRNNWSNDCVSSYCDEGYLFDKRSKSCKEIKCKNYNDNKKIFLYVGFGCLLFFLITLFFLIKCYYKGEELKEHNNLIFL